jgi:outer membrane lipoprotein-sorting protein
MRCFRLVFIAGCALAVLAADTPLQTTLAKMDNLSAGFKGMTADLRQVSHLDVIKEDTIDNGTIAVKRNAPKDVRMRVDIKPPNERKAFIGGGKVQVYYPKLNLVQEYEFGKTSSLRDQLMVLAFGSNSRDLMSAYSIRFVGPDAVANRKTSVIELTPKDKELAARFPRIQLWIDDENGMTAQQKLFQPGGDYLMATYTNQQQANLPDSAVRLDVPKDARKERPLK